MATALRAGAWEMGHGPWVGSLFLKKKQFFYPKKIA
jgi:hypothetical protein